MPFPWKKVKKNTRFSQLLSNQIHHRRKGGGSPLVVETGFPTSLIDLFVKNKERLKRQGKKNNRPFPPPPSPPPAAPPPPPPPPSDGGNDANESLVLHYSDMRDVGGAMNDNGMRDGEREGKGGGGGGVDANGVVVAILRMFLVVVVVLGTKKFVVGITLSAFLLVFLEYVGKHVCRLLRPCFRLTERLGLIIRCRRGNVDEIQQEGLSLVGCSGLMNHDQDQGMSNLSNPSNLSREIDCCLVSRNGEIECEEEEVYDGSNASSGRGRGVVDMDEDSGKVVVGEEGISCENGELSTRKSRRAKMKLRMKELVSKKLRSTRRKGQGLEDEASRSAAESVTRELRGDSVSEDPKGDSRRLRFDSVSSSSISREIDDEEDVLGCDQLVEESTEGIISLKDEEMKTEQNAGYLFPVLIVLIGLIGGRALALVLILTWYLMQKSGETLRQYIKLPFLRSI